MSGDSQPALPQTPAIDSSRSAAGTRLRGRWLLLARAIWLLVAGLSVSIMAASVVARFNAFDALYQSGLPRGWSEETFRALLARLGISATQYIVYNLVCSYTLWLSFFAVAALIFWQRSHDRMAMLVAFLLIAWPFSILTFSPLLDTQPAWSLPIKLIDVLGEVLIGLLFFLFPDARFTPRWMTIPATMLATLPVLTAIFPDTILDLQTWPTAINASAQIGMIGASLLAQVYRYRRVSSPIQRQQTKWVVFGMVGLAVGIVTLGLLPRLIFPSLTAPGMPGLLYLLAMIPLFTVFFLFLPISFGIAILRYRLWDIDIIINRALVYSALTVALALIYSVCVVSLQLVVRWLSGEESSKAVTVASTLVIITLFSPLRRRIQAAIDRRFYRRKYDAARTLAAFGATIRDEVDLDALSRALLGVVGETMQPASVALWLRASPDHTRTAEVPRQFP